MNESKFTKTGKVNPLDVLEMRKSLVCLPTFTSFVLAYSNQNSIEKWILKNCTGRYYCASDLAIDKSRNSKIKVLKIGFERQEEASYFILGCPYVQ